MPFITKDARKRLDGNSKAVPASRGELCYVFYRGMVRIWKLEPRWTTADAIYGAVRAYEQSNANEDQKRANNLAWQVFYSRFVWPYEQKMMRKNGDIK
jgi:collagenase-like PrtC family protease